MSKIVKWLKLQWIGFVDDIKIKILHTYWLLFLRKKFNQDFETIVNNKYCLETFHQTLIRWSVNLKEDEMKRWNITFIPYDEIFGGLIDNYNNLPTEPKPICLQRFMYKGQIYRVLSTEKTTYTNKFVS